MPTSRELAAAFNQKNVYEIDYDYLRSRIERVMNRTARRNIDNELKKIVSKLLIEEAIDYSIFRRQNVYSAFNGKLDPMFAERVMQTSNETGFIFGFMEIAAQCAREFTPNYQPKFMLGMTQEDTKKATDKMFGCYTRRDEAYHDLINVSGVVACMEDIENTRVDLNGKLRDYEKENDIVKGQIRETYMRKEIVKDELKKMWFWQRWFSESRRARQLKAFVKAAEKALKDVKFTKQGAADAKAEFKEPAARKDDITRSYESIGNFYEKGTAQYIKNSMFAIDYKPDRSKINAHIRCANELHALLKEGKGNLSPEAKAVFEKNFEKVKLTANGMKGRGISAAEAGAKCSAIDRELAEKYAKYIPATVDDLGGDTLKKTLFGSQGDNTEVAENAPVNAPVKEPVKVELTEKTNAIVEPIKENEITLSKEENLAK